MLHEVEGADQVVLHLFAVDDGIEEAVFQQKF